MPDDEPTADFSDLANDSRRIWNTNAEWWDDRIGDGNVFQNELIEPATERLIDAAPGTVILDIACGAGRFTRRMAKLGADIVAVDFSERFIQRARERTPPELSNIDYRVADASNPDALLALGKVRFDGAVATMALMDMACVEPLLATLPHLLKPGGWFVFSVMHPCFQSPGDSRFAESSDANGEYRVRTGVKVSHYLTPKAHKGIGIIGQPEPQWYFHRPLHVLLNAAFRHGFVVDGFEEPRLEPGEDDQRYLNWRHLSELPPILVVRLRLPKE